MMTRSWLGRNPARHVIASMVFWTVAAAGVEAGAGGRTGSDDNLYASGARTSLALSVTSGGGSGQLSILLLAIKAVLKLIVSCAIGYVLSKKGILDQTAISSLSKLIVFAFQPCLLFVNVASTLGNPGQNLSEILVLPTFAVLQIFVGSVVGGGMGTLLNLPADSPEGRELRMCASFGNSGPLPLLFVESLFGSHPDSTMVTNAVAYISFYLLGYSPLFWTVGYTMVAGKPLPAASMSEADEKQFRAMDPVHKFVARCLRVKDNPTFKRVVSPPVVGCVAGIIVGLAPWGRYLLLGKSAPLSPVYTALQSLGSAYTPAAILVLAGSLAQHPPHGEHDPHITTNTTIDINNNKTNNNNNGNSNRNQAKSTNNKNSNNGSNNNINNNHHNNNSHNSNNNNKNNNTTNATALLEALEAGGAGEGTVTSSRTAPPGYGSVPLTPPHPLGPGAAAAPDADAEAEAADASTSAPTNTAFYKKIAAIMASRFVVMPLIACGLLVLGSRMELIPSDKLIWFVLLMEACMPSSQNSVIMLQKENRSDLAASMAGTLAVVYLLSAVPIAILLSAILEFVGI